jgi:hypothetical protein
LENLLNKARKGLVSIRELVDREHEISVSQETLNRKVKEDDQIRRKIEEAGVDDVDLTVEEGAILVRGRFRKKGVSGGFRVRMRPGEPIWEADRHAIRLHIVDQDVDFDRNVTGLVAGLGSKVASGLFGYDLVGGRIRDETDGGAITLDLDGSSRLLDTVITSIQANRLECRPGRVVFAFTPDPSHAMANAKALLTWWKDRKAEKD